jgi:hypothetical protein
MKQCLLLLLVLGVGYKQVPWFKCIGRWHSASDYHTLVHDSAYHCSIIMEDDAITIGDEQRIAISTHKEDKAGHPGCAGTVAGRPVEAFLVHNDGEVYELWVFWKDRVVFDKDCQCKTDSTILYNLIRKQ